MTRYQLSDPAKADIAAILKRSAELNGLQARVRYRALLTAAMRRVAGDPEASLTADLTGLLSGIRSFHIHHSRKESREGRVARPAHVLFYRPFSPGRVEVVRILHERMDPRMHLGAEDSSRLGLDAE
jgi:toxin ParE1/3/4